MPIAVQRAKLFDCGDHSLLFLRDRIELRRLSAADASESPDVWPGRGEIDTDDVEAESEQVVDAPADGSAILVDRLRRRAVQASGPLEQAGERSRPSIDRLTLTVSNVCNLGCSYCYAAKGTYYNKSGLLMTPETAFAALNQASHAYDRIEHINFFGGEPTLNCEVIRAACEYTRFLYQRGVLSHMPSFGITTNGHALSQAVMRLLTDYSFSVTMSLDGPREIHDAARPTKGGVGSYDTVSATARTLVERGLEIEFECTYSVQHLRRGVSIVDLMDFFHEEFGCRTIHCQVVSAAPDSPEFIPLDICLRLQAEAIEASIDNLAHGTPKAISLAARLLHALASRTPIWNYCPAGRKEVTVNADGDVYACFMLMERPDYSFGSLLPEPGRDRKAPTARGPQKLARGSQKQHIEDLLSQQDKYNNVACQRCWAQPLCHGCLGEDFARSAGEGVVRSAVPGESEFCDYKRALIESFLRAVGRADAGVHGRLARSGAD